MPIDSVKALISAIKQSKLLEASQLAELEKIQGNFTDPRLVLKELLQADWLTPYQANQIFQGGGKDLVLGPYVILARLAESALGQVYKARHRRMNRLVSLKVIRPELLARPEAVERFYQETQIISQLADPHVVHAYDAGPIGQTHFFAMEYVEGVDLETLVQHAGPLAADVATNFIGQTAQGLQHAHERKLTHGDLRPGNLLVSRSMTQGTTESASSSWRSILASATGGGAVVKINNLGLTFLQSGAEAAGSPDYLAPERCQGGAGDIRSDLYSLGAIFYFLLAGRVPFPGGAVADKMRRHQTEEPVPLPLLRKDAPGGIVNLVGKLMAKKPQSRFQTPAELVQALGRVR
jgi:serine/threonine-protein kinase